MNRTMKKIKVLDIDKDPNQTLNRLLWGLVLGPCQSSAAATILPGPFSENPSTLDIWPLRLTSTRIIPFPWCLLSSFLSTDHNTPSRPCCIQSWVYLSPLWWNLDIYHNSSEWSLPLHFNKCLNNFFFKKTLSISRRARQTRGGSKRGHSWWRKFGSWFLFVNMWYGHWNWLLCMTDYRLRERRDSFYNHPWGRKY